MIKKRKKLSFEILGDLAIALAAALFLCLMLYFVSIYIADSYMLNSNTELSDIDYDYMNSRILSFSVLISAVSFVVLFLALLGQRLACIPRIMKGIEALESDEGYEVKVEGGDELSELATAVNDISERQRRVRTEEKALMQEKEDFIRSLSHDIRTPLTSIIAYSEYMSQNEISDAERAEYLELIYKKSIQIKELTDILLGGGMRKLEYFEDARLLFCQLVDEMEASLEADFKLETELPSESFSGSFDVRELQRIFDNLSSNIAKYAESLVPVRLSVKVEGTYLSLTQSNGVREKGTEYESHGIGLESIRRIAELYGGKVEVRDEKSEFSIKITLSL